MTAPRQNREALKSHAEANPRFLELRHEAVAARPPSWGLLGWHIGRK